MFLKLLLPGLQFVQMLYIFHNSFGRVGKIRKLYYCFVKRLKNNMLSNVGEVKSCSYLLFLVVDLFIVVWRERPGDQMRIILTDVSFRFSRLCLNRVARKGGGEALDVE